MKLYNYRVKSSKDFEVFLDRYALILAAMLSIIAGCWIFEVLVDGHLLPTTDLGQWVMYSRAYNNLPLPAYRWDHGVSPLIPIVLALTSHLSSAIGITSALVSAGLYTLMQLTVFLLAKQLFNSSWVAILSLLLIGYAQYFFAYLISFGGLPQLSAIIFTNISLIALIQVAKSSGQKGNLLLCISALLVVLSHLPSAPIFFLTIFIALIVISIQKKLGAWLLLRIASCTLGIPIFVCAAFIAVYLDQEIQYATNEAGFYLRGIDTAFQSFNWSWPFILMPIFAMLSFLWLSFVTVFKKQQMLYFTVTILWIWFLIPMIFMVISYLLRVGTDYQRFLYYSIQPPLFGFSYQLGYFLIKSWQQFLQFPPKRLTLNWLLNLQTLVLTLSFLLFLAANIQFTERFYQQAVSYFSPKFGDDLLDLSKWLSETDQTTAVVIPSLAEANWVEGISGKATLFPNKFRFLYRAGLEQRSLTTDFITTGISKIVDNGHMLTLFADSGSTPSDPGIYVYQRGEYYDAIIFQDRLTNIDAKINELLIHLNLMHDFSRSTTVQLTNDNSYTVKSHYSCKKQRCGVSVNKMIAINEQSSSVYLQLQIIAKTPNIIEQLDISIADPRERTWSLGEKTLNQSDAVWVDKSIEKLVIHRNSADGNYTAGSIQSAPSPSQISIEDKPISNGNPYLTMLYRDINKSVTTIQLEFNSYSQWHFNSKVVFYNVSELIDIYHIGYLVAERSNLRRRKLYDLQYKQVYSNRAYVVYKVSK